MLHDPARHEPLREQPWNEARARACIARIVDGLEDEFVPGFGWRVHPLDDPKSPDELSPSLYCGACGVIWSLNYLRAVGAANPRHREWLGFAQLLDLTRRWLGEDAERERAAYLMGETPNRMLEHWLQPSGAVDDELAHLIGSNSDHPARELMWGAPGTLLAALHLQRHTGQSRWARLFRQTAQQLKAQMIWSEAQSCWYWTQDLYGMHVSCLDAVHGFVATALP
ncbi:MAG: lanthionine synthetase, partial [Gemmatimonadota bacterium]